MQGEMGSENKSVRHVVVGMSGGVDSSTVAALLVEQGYQVTGMMLRLWSEEGKECFNQCCTPDSVFAARRIAAMLGIPFYVIDAQQLFYDKIVNYFIDGYKSGETPNPCILCNQFIRWGFLLDHALSIGADAFATGHYARLMKDLEGNVHLLTGVDKEKDQSYVLSMLSQTQLQKTLLPLGEMTKSEVRLHARRFHLPVAEKHDSQDLCFLGDEDYRDFLVKYAPESLRPGKITTMDGREIGDHEGLAAYTIGQRKGIRIADTDAYYVMEKDYERNVLIVGKKFQLGKKEIMIKDFHWINDENIDKDFTAEVMVRYRASLHPAIIRISDDNGIQIHFDIPVQDITAGQLAVVYQDNEVLGGGFIQSEVRL
jgi:tRNA-specific 2-thiouridylase